MAASDNLSLEQLQSLLDYHGGTILPHADKGGFQVTLSQRTGQRWKMDNVHYLDSLESTHPIISRVIEESRKEGLM